MEDAKTIPYTFDLGNLCCFDANPQQLHESSDREVILANNARDCAQALVNQLLTACPITRSEDDGALQLTLPAPATALPREKPVPKEKEKTKWERFAEKKGIKPKRRDGKLTFDETKKDWIPKYGYKGKRNPGEVSADWLEEVDDKPEREQANGASGANKSSNSSRVQKSRPRGSK